MENVSKMTNLSVEFFHIGDIGYLLHGKIFQNSYNGGPNHVFFPKWRKMTSLIKNSRSRKTSPIRRIVGLLWNTFPN